MESQRERRTRVHRDVVVAEGATLYREPSTSGEEDRLLSPAAAALIAERSIRTIRRAYRSGALAAFRDGNGRGVRISSADLHRWLRAGTAASSEHQDSKAGEPPAALARLDMTRRTERMSENRALLDAARARRRGGAAGGRS